MSRAVRARRWGLCAAAAIGMTALVPMTPAAAGTETVFIDVRSGQTGAVGGADSGTTVSTDGGATFVPATVVAPLAGWAVPNLGQWVSSDADRGTSTAGVTTLFRSEFRVGPGPVGSDLDVCVHAADAAAVRLNGVEIGAQPTTPIEANAQEPAECFELPVANLLGGYNELEFEVPNAAGEMGLWFRLSGLVTVDADAAPVLVLPGDVVADAAGPEGRVVFYSAGGIYHGPGPWPIPACTPPSGSLFAVGTTTVTCTATNPVSGASSTGTFLITVVAPNQPPQLHLPADVTVPATSAAGAVVGYTATATDDGTAEPDVVCGPPSGATFPVGTTVVTCTATDAEGLTTTGSFGVTVTAAAPDYLARLGTAIAEGRNIRADIRTLLASKHRQATANFSADQRDAGCRRLAEMGAIVARYRGAGIPYGKATNLRNLIAASWVQRGC